MESGAPSIIRTKQRRRAPQPIDRLMAFDTPVLRCYTYEKELDQPLPRRIMVPEGRALLAVCLEGSLLVPQLDRVDRLLATQYSSFLCYGPMTALVAHGRGEQHWVEFEWPLDRLKGLADWSTRMPYSQSAVGNFACSNLLRCRDTFERDLHSLLEEIQHPTAISEPFLTSFVHLATSSLLTNPCYFHLASVSTDVAGPIKSLALKIVSEPSADWTLEDAASEIGYSPFHLSRTFKLNMGMKLIKFVTRARVARAAQLALETEETFESIAEACGFGTSHALRKSMKQEIGFLPSELRGLQVYIA